MAGEKPKSVLWVTLSGVGLIVFFGWGFMAGMYARDVERFQESQLPREQQQRYRGRRGVGSFVANAIAQVPNAPAVIGSALRDHIWVPFLTGALVILMLLFGVGMRIVEARLEATDARWKPTKTKQRGKVPRVPGSVEP